MHAVCRLREVTFIQFYPWFYQRIFWTNCVHLWYGVGVTTFIDGAELMRFGKVTLQSTKINIKWLWPVKVTLEVIMRRLMVFCWSCDEGPLKWDKKIAEPPVYQYGSNEYTLESRPSPQMVGQCLLKQWPLEEKGRDRVRETEGDALVGRTEMDWPAKTFGFDIQD